MKHITIVAGARPNFVKIAPIIHEIIRRRTNGTELSYSLVHTGQHYDKKMSGDFLRQLDIPDPDVNLGAGGGTQAEQTAAIMIGFERYLQQNATDLVLVVGDVTSTMACAVTAKKQKIRVAHVEAGIRSNDWGMPEEINRLITDSITDYFFTTTRLASANLERAGHSAQSIFFVGNCMIDTLLAMQEKFEKPTVWDRLGLTARNFLVITLHRPANVDEASKLKSVFDQIMANTNGLPVIFPVHPRTSTIFAEAEIQYDQLHVVPPMSYLEFNYLVSRSLAVITDSGGITEETTVMGIPCLTLRDNTERPETVSVGTNELVGTDPNNIPPALNALFSGNWKKGNIPELWDGHCAERIVDQILSH